MFTGEVRHQLDTKNRIRIPAKFKNELGEDFVFMKGFQCVCVYPREVFEKVVKEEIYTKFDRFSKQSSVNLRRILSAIETPTPDEQGRILLSKSLREYAGISKNVVTVGVLDHLEIMAEEVADDAQDNGEEAYEELMKYFSKSEG